MIETAKAILGRGDIVLIFPEGTRTRPGALGKPKRGVGRLALETGAPVVPVAVIGTEAVRRGWRIRPHKVRIRAGRPLRFPHGRARLAGAGDGGDRADLAVRDAPVGVARRPSADPPRGDRRRRATGARASRCALASAGFDVDLGCRTAEQAGARCRARVRTSATFPASAPRLGQRDARLRARARRCTTSSAWRSPLARCRRSSPLTASGSRGAPGSWSCPRASSHHWARCRRRSPPSAARARAVAVLGGPSHAAEVIEHRRLGRASRRSTAGSPASSPTRWPRRGTRRLDHDRRDRRRACRLREERRRRSPPPRRRPPVRTWPAPPPARCSPRSTRWRGCAAGARRPSPASPAPATWSRPSSRRARATAAPASCSPREFRAPRSGTALGQAAEAVDAVPLLATRRARRPAGHAGARQPRRARRGPDRARAVDRDRDRSRRAASARALSARRRPR